MIWKTIKIFLDRRAHLITGNIEAGHTALEVDELAQKVREKSGALDNYIGFIDGTVLEITRPDNAVLQKIVYNGHKRKHVVKSQAIITADEMFYHVFGPIEGRHHD